MAGALSGPMTRHKPRGLTKWLLGAPRWLYKARLGFLFGKRFGMIEHVGRKSGRVYQTPLEVVTHQGDRYVICSGWGPGADWYRNIQATPAVAFWVGSRRSQVDQQLLTAEEGAAELGEYRKNHPSAARTLWKAMGLDDDGSSDGLLRAAETIPTVALELKR